MSNAFSSGSSGIEPFGGMEHIPLVNWRYLAAALGSVVATILVIAVGNIWALNFVHVLLGMLWTGIDLFMGFVLGPIMRRLDLAARRQIVSRLMPRMLFLMPALSINTGTAGWFLADKTGFTALPYPQYGWVLASLILLVLLTVQGLGLLLPTNLLVYLELRKTQPDHDRISRLMHRYVRATATQGIMQVLMIIIMARFVTGIG